MLVGKYWVSDFPNAASAGGAFNFRCNSGVPSVESDCSEGVLCWSGNIGERASAHASLVPFLRESPVQALGRLEDLGEGSEVEQVYSFGFINGRFSEGGWEDGYPGEWSYIAAPGDLYRYEISPSFKKETFNVDEPSVMTLNVDGFNHTRFSNDKGSMPRISLIHVNRNREEKNLVPWTMRPPRRNSKHVQTLLDCRVPKPGLIECRLDQFNIRGGWRPGKYHLSVRIQNFHEPGSWTWSSQVSKPIKLRIDE